MATYLFTLNRRQLRDKVARRLGIKAAGNSLHPERRAVINEGIDLRLKQLHGRNTLWFSTSGAAADVVLTSGDPTVDLINVGFLYATTVHVRVGDQDEPVKIIDHRTYQDIPDKARAGQPCMVFFDGATMYLYPVPDTGYTLKLTYQQHGADSSDAEALDMRSDAMGSFANLVALDLADEFDVDELRINRWRGDRDTWESDILAAGAQVTDTPAPTADYF
jgi:hypothetical protein